MNNWKSSYWLWLVCLAGACKQDVGFNPKPPPQYGPSFWGEVSGTRNGIAMMNPRINGTLQYKVVADTCTATTFALLIREFDNDGCVRLDLSMVAISRKLGASKAFQYGVLMENCHPNLLPHFVLYVSECDIALGTYTIDPKKESQLAVQALDLKTGDVNGVFDLNFVVSKRPYESAPDTLHCVGTFKTKLLPGGQLKYQ